MASRKYIAEDASDLVGNTPMVYLKSVTKGCQAKVGGYIFFIVYLTVSTKVKRPLLFLDSLECTVRSPECEP
uniref:Cysteine synthase n=1 Tax=Parascaris equorum TaxID=6256 RepID=A0A914S6E3_PAREQ